MTVPAAIPAPTSTRRASFTARLGFLPTLPWRPQVAGVTPGFLPGGQTIRTRFFTARLGFLPTLPWRPQVAGVTPGGCLHEKHDMLSFSLGRLRRLVLIRPSGPDGSCGRCQTLQPRGGKFSTCRAPPRIPQVENMRPRVVRFGPPLPWPTSVRAVIERTSGDGHGQPRSVAAQASACSSARSISPRTSASSSTASLAASAA